ncbi:hypothetical protein Hanom_Chr06g00531851 [Helianthus anomalus]
MCRGKTLKSRVVTLGDIYYETYTEERANEAHVPICCLKQKDTFVDFAACRDWFLGTFPPGEANHQRACNHESLYHTYIIGEANTSASGHQILRDWRTMHRERASWEKRLPLTKRRSSRNGDVANSILNATELDKAIVALIEVARVVGHRGGYVECAQHVEEALHQHFRTRHYSVTDQADEMLARAEEV